MSLLPQKGISTWDGSGGGTGLVLALLVEDLKRGGPMKIHTTVTVTKPKRQHRILNRLSPCRLQVPRIGRAVLADATSQSSQTEIHLGQLR